MKTLLSVPFSEKDKVKSLGARWSPDDRAWYIPDGVDHDAFAKWLSGNTTSQPTHQQTAVTPVNDSPAAATKLPDGAMRLSDFLGLVSEAIRKKFPGSTWLQVELSKINNRGGHAYFDLVEYDDQGRELAKSRGNLWSNKKQAIFNKFKMATGGDMQDGMKLLLLVRPEFSAQYGLSLIIEDIDPAYTLGDMQAKLQKIRDDLKRAGIFDLNRKLAGPFDFIRVAVVSPENAAGLADFMREAEILQQAGLCHFDYRSAVFQGVQASGSIIAALNSLTASHALEAYDALVIIRGGGAAADLAWLNDFELAQAVCRLPLPVFTGIGHQIDDTILDEVAFRRFDTPSKVSAFIAGTIIENALLADRSMTSIMNDARQAVLLAESRIGTLMQSVQSSSLRLLAMAETQVDEAYRSLFVHAEIKLEMAAERLKNFMTEILGLSPRNTLARGYAVIRGANGKPLTSINQATPGDEVELELRDGRLPAKVI